MRILPNPSKSSFSPAIVVPTLAETDGPFEHQCSVGDKDNCRNTGIYKDNYRNTEIHNHIHGDTKEGSALPNWSNQSVSNISVHCILIDIFKIGLCKDL